MSKQSLLLVDGDTRSLRVLEVSLRKAGFMVTAATSVQDALGKLVHAPDLIISETTFPDGDGFELRRRVRATAEWSEIPFIFLTAEAAIENKIRGLELGVDDYLTKPIYIKEIVTRINILLQKRQRVRFEERRDGRTRFTGRVQDMPVVDVIQTIEISRKSGVIQFVGERGRQAAIYFRDGRVIDAEAGSLQGEDAVFRLLTWSEGEFEVVFRTVRRREVITMSSQGLLMEGMRRLDEWSRLFEQLPPLTHRFEVDTHELAARLGDVPDDNNRILRLFDGKRTLLEVIDASDVGDLECLQAISRLYFEELLLDLDHDKAPRRDTGKPMPAVSAPESEEGDAGAWAEDPREEGGVTAAAQGADDDGGSESEGATDEDGAGDAAEDSREMTGGPLLGGYRPSSLRLIDEAVAAAQAIEPSLFEDTPAALEENRSNGVASNGVASSERNGVAGNGVASSERNGLHEAPSAAADSAAMGQSARREDSGLLQRLREDSGLLPRPREDSGLRMIGSLGRDRAEASGELAPVGQTRARRNETARELVTILPRRATRELPAQELADSLPTPTPTASVVVEKPVAAVSVEPPAAVAPALPHVPLPGTGVRAISGTRRLLRSARWVEGGPGLGALLLIVLAAVLAGTAVFLRLRRHAAPAVPAESIEPKQPEGGASGSELSPSRSPAGSSIDGRLGSGMSGASASVVTAAEKRVESEPRAGGSPSERGAGGGAADGGRGGGAAAGAARPARGADSGTGERGSSGTAATGARGGSESTGGGSTGRDGVESTGGASGARGGSEATASEAGRAGADAGATSGRAGAGNSVEAATSGRAGASNSVETTTSGRGAAGTAPQAATSTAPRNAAGSAAEAKALYDKAQVALEESDFERAFELSVASLRLRRTARTYLLRAQAEQRLDRVDAALASVAAASELAPELGAVWETRGRILWAARRRDDARIAFEKFLELEPNSPKAPSVRRLLNEPR